MENDCVAICSGGLDSTVMLYWLLAQGRHPIVVSFDYGQRHKEKELKCITKTCEKLGLRHHIFKIDISQILKKSALIDPEKEMPHEHYTDETQRITVVPNRNMIMLSIAIACAENEGLNEVYYSPHANDEAIYPDCREEFVLALSTASYLGTYEHVVVIAPFVKQYKSDLVEIGYKLGVPFEDTWSCYEGKEKACGQCATSLPGHTLVLMEDWSWKPISEMKVGDTILSYDFTYKPARLVPTKVLNVMNHGMKLVKRYKSENTIIDMTPDHRILTVNSKSNNTTFKEIQDVVNSQYNVCYSFSYTPINDEFRRGWVAGYFYHDGALEYDKQRDVVYGFRCVSDSRNTLQEVAEVCNTLGFKTVDGIHKSSFNSYAEGYYPQLRLSGRQTSEEILTLIQNIENESELVKLGYISGAMDADGYLDGNSLRFFQSIKHQDRIDKFINVLNDLGLSHSTTRSKDRIIVALSKKALFKVPPLTTHRRRNLKYSIQGLQNTIIDTGFAYRTEVWDITTETGNFIANGMVVHNCQERIEAFQKNGLIDPIPYEIDITW